MSGPDRANTTLLRTPASLKGYLHILFGLGLILSHLHWLSVVLLPSSLTLLSPQVPALIAAPTLQVSLISHLLCISHTCSLPLSLAPDPIPLMQSSQTSQAHNLVAFGAPRMPQCPEHLFGVEAKGLDGFMDSWAQLHLLYISIAIYVFTLHLTNNMAVKDLAEHAQTHTHWC